MKSGTLSCAADDKLRTQRRSATGEKRYSRRAVGEPGPPPTRRREEDSHRHTKVDRRAGERESAVRQGRLSLAATGDAADKYRDQGPSNLLMQIERLMKSGGKGGAKCWYVSAM